MAQGQTALDWVLGSPTSQSGKSDFPADGTALDWVMGVPSEPSPASRFSIPDIGAEAAIDKSGGFQPLLQSQTGATGGPTGPEPAIPPPSGGTGTEDLVRGLELGFGRMAKFGGETYAKARNAVFQGEQTRAEMGRNVQRAGKLGDAITAQGLTHAEPTSFPGKLAQGVGEVGSMAALGPAGPVLMGGAGVEDRYDQILKETGSEIKATEAAAAEIPLQVLQMFPVMRLIKGGSEAATLTRKVFDGIKDAAIGPGAARVVGAVVGDQITKEDKADLLASLKSGAAQAAKEFPQNAALFGFLNGIAGIGEEAKAQPEKGTSGAAKADVLAGGQEPSKISEGMAHLPEDTAALPSEMSASEASAQLQGGGKTVSPEEHAQIVEAAKAYQANPTPKARVQLASVATPRPEPPKTTPEPRPSIQAASQDPTLQEIAGRYLNGGERGKLDAREQLQDSMREFLTPQDIQDIAMWKPGAARTPSQEPTSPSEPAPTVPVVESPQDKAPVVSSETPVGETQAPTEAPSQEPAVPSQPVPGEARPSEEPLTSLKEKTVAEERAGQGFDPIEKAASRGYEDVVWPEATKKMQEDPGLGPRLAAEIAEKARPLSDVEAAILLRNKVQSHNEIKALDAEILKAQETGDALGGEALKKQRQEASNRDLAAQEAATRANSETGRGLAAIRMMAAEDNSYAGIETQARIAAGGRELTEPERAEIKDLSEKLIAAQKKVAEYESKKADAETVRVAKEIKKDPARQAKLLSFLQGKADAAEARIKARGTRAMAGLDPVDMADRVIVGTNLIAHDLATFAEWSGEMLRKFGETIRPHLEDIFARSKESYAQAVKLPSKQQAQNTRMKGELAKVKGQVEAEPFTPPPKRLVSRVPLDEEGVKLHADLQEARNTRARLIQKYDYEHRSPFKKTLDVGKELLNLPKAVMTAYDFSAVLRQGAFFSFGHPIETLKSFPKMFAATFSERKALEIDVALRNRPHADLGNKVGLELTQLGDAPGKHEEAIRSAWSDYIPGIRASNRAFITFLNMQRTSAFDAMVDAIPGGATPEQAKPLANLANIATGRGNPGSLAGAVSAASNVLWSPRLLLSRFQLLAGQPLYRGDAVTRTLVAKQYARSLAGVAAVLALGKLAGGKIEDDPRSSDFGKIRFGDTRVDPLAGLSQVTVLASRIISGETKNAAGQVEPIRPPIIGEGKGPGFGQTNTADLLARFLRTKLSPTIGVPIDILTGKDVTGQPATLGSEAKNLAVPLSFQDILKAMEDQGIPKGVALGILSTFGVGLQSYADHTPAPKGLPRLRGMGMPRMR